MLVAWYTVGCSWIWSMSTVAAPTASAISMPSPVAPGWLVVTALARLGLNEHISSKFAPKPPVASTTALALMV